GRLAGADRGEQDVLGPHVAVSQPDSMLDGPHDEVTSFLGEALEHHRLPRRRPYLRGTVCFVTPRRSAMSCQDQPSSRAACTGSTSSPSASTRAAGPSSPPRRSASTRSAAPARSPTSGSLLAAPSAISSTTGSMRVSI